MPRGIYDVQTDLGIYHVEADSEAEALATVQAALKPATTNVQYGEGAAPDDAPTVGQSDFAAVSPPDPRYPQGSRFNPAYDTTTRTAAGNRQVPFFVNRLGELVDQTDGESGLDTMGTLAARFALSPVLGAPVADAMFPSGRLEAMQSGATSGLLGGLKNEAIAAGAGLGGAMRGTGYKGAYDETLTGMDERDRFLRAAYPNSYYGAGGAGMLAGGALTPEIKAGGAGVQALARMLPGQAAVNAPRLAKAGQLAMDTGVAAGSSWGSADPGERDAAAIVGGGGAIPLSVMTRGMLKGAPRAAGTPKQILMDAGVRLTPGQLSGRTATSIESKLTSVPLLGDAIKSGERVAKSDFNLGAVNMVLDHVGETVPKGISAGHDAVAYAGDRLGALYDNALSRATAIPDVQFDTGVTSVANSIVTPAQRDTFTSIVDNYVRPRFQAGAISGDAIKTLDSDLSTFAGRYKGSAVASERELGDAISAVRDEIRALVARQNPAEAAQLNKLDRAWADLVRVENAASKTGAESGEFTPAQLMQGVRAADNSVRKRAVARGTALMQEYAQAGKTVMPSYPDSGTAGRAALIGTGVGGAGLFATNPAAGVAATAGLLASPLAYRGLGVAMRNAPRAGRAVAAVPGARAAGRLTGKAVPRLIGQLAANSR